MCWDWARYVSTQLSTKAGNILGHVLFRKIYSGLSFQVSLGQVNTSEMCQGVQNLTFKSTPWSMWTFVIKVKKSIRKLTMCNEN